MANTAVFLTLRCIHLRFLVHAWICIILAGCGKMTTPSAELVTPGHGPVLAEFPYAGQSIFINANMYILGWTLLGGSASLFAVVVYNGLDCTGIVLNYEETTRTNYVMKGLKNTFTYSTSIKAYGSDNVASEPICIGNFVVDTQYPTISFVSPSQGSATGVTTYTFSWSATDVGLSGLQEEDTFSIELFNNGACAGIAQDEVMQKSKTFVWSGLNDGAIYSIRIKAYDKAGNVSLGTCSPSLIVDASLGS